MKTLDGRNFLHPARTVKNSSMVGKINVRPKQSIFKQVCWSLVTSGDTLSNNPYQQTANRDWVIRGIA
jgi:hypothetical protein